MSAVDEQIAAIEGGKPAADVAAAIEKFRGAEKPLAAGEGDASENLAAIGELLAGLATDVEGSDRAPTQPQRGVLVASNERLARALARWDGVKHAQLAQLNAALQAAGKAPVAVPGADKIHLQRAPESKELP